MNDVKDLAPYIEGLHIQRHAVADQLAALDHKLYEAGREYAQIIEASYSLTLNECAIHPRLFGPREASLIDVPDGLPEALSLIADEETQNDVMDDLFIDLVENTDGPSIFNGLKGRGDWLSLSSGRHSCEFSPTPNCWTTYIGGDDHCIFCYQPDERR